MSTLKKAYGRAPATRREDVETKLRRLRRHQRQVINVRAVVHSGLSIQQTTIRDISDGGVGISGASGLYPGAKVKIALLTGEARVGVVRWWLAGCCGIQFSEPMSASDQFLEAALRRSATRQL